MGIYTKYWKEKISFKDYPELKNYLSYLTNLYYLFYYIN